MTFEVRETYVNSSEGHMIGDSGWYEPYTEDRGKLFRDFQHEYGGCTGHMYVDVKVPRFGPDFRGITAFGKVVYPQYDYRVDTVGWVFSRREHYEDARPAEYRNGKPVYREQDYYTREVWVHVRNEPAAWGWQGKAP